MFLWRWSKFYCINNYDYDDCFSACSYNLSYLLYYTFNIMNVLCEYLSFFGYDVSFVDVVKFDYRNFYIKFIHVY